VYEKKSPLVDNRHRDDWLNRGTTLFAPANKRLAAGAAPQAKYRSLIPLGVTQDAPERNSRSSYVSGSIAP